MKHHPCATLGFAALLCLSSLSAQAADVLTPGFLKLSLYTNIAGVAVADLTSDAKYPANPDEVRYLRSLNTRDALPTDALDGYGGRIEGFLTPLESGDYNFFLRSDSQSELYLSTDDTEGAAVLIAEETDNGEPFVEPEAGDVATTQTPITLVSGTKYFIEVLYKGKFPADPPDGENQTDFAQVAWRKVGDTTPAAALKPIPGAFLSTFASNAGAPTVSFTQNPANVSVAENAQTTFTVAVNASPADNVSIQWQRNGVNIPGATGTSFTTSIDKADNGVPFRAVASVPGAVANSTAATVTVTPADSTKPALVSALGGPNRPTVTLTFSERVSTATAENPANYLITAAGGTVPNVTGAVLSADRTAVTLQLDAQGSIGTNYTVTVNNVADLAVPTPNVILANSKANFLPRGPWLEGADGFVVFEAEDYDRNSIDSTSGVKWFADSERGTASGVSMVSPWGTPGVDEHILLEYDIYFTKVGTHYIWVRASADNGNSDSCYLHVDGVRPRAGNLSVLTGIPTNLDSTYDWAGYDNDAGQLMFFDVPGPGVHTIGLGPREPGFFMDKIVITADPAFVPTDFGPPVTARQTQLVALSTDFGITTQPVDTAGAEHGTITVTAGVLVPQAAYTLQWQRKNGPTFVDISGADTTGVTSPSLTISPLTMGWNGAVVRLKMTSGGVDKFSNEVTITVIPDTTRPNLLGADGLAALNRVRLRYSEPVDAATAQTTGNYQITGPLGTLAVTSATLLPGLQTVELITAAQTVGQKYTVTVSNVRDLAFTPNVIDQNQAKFYSLGALQAQGPDGLLVFEAENYDRNLADDWTEDHARGNPSGGTSMAAPAGGSESGSQLEYDLTFTKTGTNIIWWRASAIDGVSDSAWFHVDGERPPNRTDANQASLSINAGLPDYTWFDEPQDGGGQMTFEIGTAGLHTIGVGRREPNAFFDKFVITTDPAFNPEAYGPFGPPESRAGQPALPTLAITSPANSAQFNEGASIPITVTIGATTRVIAKVEYFSDGNKIGESTSSPYNFTWLSAPVGTHDLTARVTDDVDAMVNSPAVAVVVNAAQGIILTGTMAPGGLVLTWTGGTAPYTVQQKATLTDAWVNVLTTNSLTATFPTTNQTGFFRVGSQ